MLFSYVKTKAKISCAVTARLISAFVFAVWIVESIYFPNVQFLLSDNDISRISSTSFNCRQTIFLQNSWLSLS